MKVEITKGNWSIRYPNADSKDKQIVHCFIDSDKSNLSICRVHSNSTDRSEVEANANAKLIAAAPELLEALKSMLNLFGRNLPEGSIGERVCNEAKAAIKKATEL